jgi:hypothetical protein
MDARLLKATVGGEHLSQTQNEILRHQLLASGAFDQRKSTQFTPLSLVLLRYSQVVHLQRLIHTGLRKRIVLL